MEFDLSDEQNLIIKTARDYAQKSLAPHAAARDIQKTFPEKELRELADLGLLTMNIPAEYGGTSAGTVAYVLAMQELAGADASVSVAVSVTNMVAEIICLAGSDAQKQEHLPRISDGSYLVGSFGLSEPQSGSDPSAILTTAQKTSTGEYVLNGTKQWITSGDRAGMILVWARTDAQAGHRGLSVFLVRGPTPGLTVTRHEEKMGLYGSSTVQLHFEDVRVSADALLGREGDGFKLAMQALDGGRIGIASQGLGIAKMAHRAALKYAQERKQFGVTLIEHQAIANMLADMATWLAASDLLVLRAAWRKENHLPFTREAAMAKLFATEKAGLVCDLALQIHGGYGYTKDFPIERAVRDVRVTRIYEGTSEIQRIVIARQLVKEFQQKM